MIFFSIRPKEGASGNNYMGRLQKAQTHLKEGPNHFSKMCKNHSLASRDSKVGCKIHQLRMSTHINLSQIHLTRTFSPSQFVCKKKKINCQEQANHCYSSIQKYHHHFQLNI